MKVAHAKKHQMKTIRVLVFLDSKEPIAKKVLYIIMGGGGGVIRVVSDGDVAMGTKMKPQKIHQAREVNICLLSLKSPVFSLKRINFPNLSPYR